MTTSNTGFSISRTTNNGVQEFLTSLGFRSTESIKLNGTEISRFSQIEGWAKIKELKSNCRLPRLAKSITLNY